MRIACPACAAAYEVPDRLLAGPARTLRCSRCGTEFALPRAEAREPVAPPPAEAAPPEPSPPPPAVAPEPPIPAAPPPAAAPRPEPRPEPRAFAQPVPEPASPALLRAWVATIAVVLAVIVALLVFRAEVMAAWPASRRLFAALGLA